MTPFCTILFSLLLAPFLTGLLASVLSALAVLRNQKPPWSYGMLSASAGLFASLVLVFRGDVLRPARWPGRVSEHWEFFLMFLAPSLCLTGTVVVGAIVVFRDRYRRNLTISERRALRQQRKEKSWRRTRWFRLAGSCVLMSVFTGVFLLSLEGPRVSEEKEVTDNYGAAYIAESGGAMVPPAGKVAPRAKPLVDLSPAVVIAGPFCFLGMLGGGFWFAHTVAYWHGHLRVGPRHRRELLHPHRSPARLH